MFLDLTSEFYAWIRGAFLILAIYHFMVYIQNRSQTYLFYSIYLILQFLYFCRHIATGQLQQLYEYINFSIQFVMFGFYVLFARSLLQTRKKIPDWDLLLRIEYKIFFALSALFVIIQAIYSYEHQEKLFITIMPVFTVFALLTYIVFTKIKGRYVTFFIIGSLTYVILANMSLLLPVVFGDELFAKYKIDPMFFTYVGTMIEVTMFALIVGARVTYLERKAQDSKKDLALKNKQMSDLRMTALQSQMDPHFLYNSLNSINNFILKNDPEKASDYITKFSRLIREILQRSSSSSIPLSEELGILGLYVKLEQMRMAGGFDYIVTIDDDIDLEQIQVPPLFLQPYIENAIWHGFVNKTHDKKITLAIYNDDDNIRCEIADNGIGIEQSKLNKQSKGIARKSFGLKTSEDRIKLLYENKKVYVVIEDLSNIGESGTKVTVKFPKKM